MTRKQQRRPTFAVELDEHQYFQAKAFYARRERTLEDVIAELLVDDMARLEREELAAIKNPWDHKPFWLKR